MFCSALCAARYNNSRRKKEKPSYICKLCGITFTTNSRRAKDNPPQYCGIVCRNRAISKTNAQRPILGKRCPTCGHYGFRINEECYKCNKTITRAHNIWNEERTNYLIEHYPNDGSVKVGEALGISSVKVSSQASKLHIKVCKEALRKLVYDPASIRMADSNPMHNQDSLNKMLNTWENNPEKKARRSQKFLDGKLEYQKTKPSKLEIKLRNILDDLGIEYEPSFLIKPKFIVDIRIGNLIIQADGEYWHGHPRFYPLTKRQEDQQKRDRSQDKYLQTCGYTVIRIWDRDVTKENIEEVIRNHS
jgi:G:T-mismatch repair DNA endonuclease (very short patch repair protein)